MVAMALGSWHLNGSILPTVHYVLGVELGGGQWVSGPGHRNGQKQPWHHVSIVWCLLYSVALDRCLYFREISQWCNLGT